MRIAVIDETKPYVPAILGLDAGGRLWPEDVRLARALDAPSMPGITPQVTGGDALYVVLEIMTAIGPWRSVTTKELTDGLGLWLTRLSTDQIKEILNRADQVGLLCRQMTRRPPRDGTFSGRQLPGQSAKVELNAFFLRNPRCGFTEEPFSFGSWASAVNAIPNDPNHRGRMNRRAWTKDTLAVGLSESRSRPPKFDELKGRQWVAPGIGDADTFKITIKEEV